MNKHNNTGISRADQISKRMSLVRTKNTIIERSVKGELKKLGIKIDALNPDLPGKPDIILNKYRMVIFVHGCFWHGCKCKKGQTKPKTNVGFWKSKIARTRIRDKENKRDLAKLGWKVLTIWECEIKAKKVPANLLKNLPT